MLPGSGLPVAPGRAGPGQGVAPPPAVLRPPGAAMPGGGLPPGLLPAFPGAPGGSLPLGMLPMGALPTSAAPMAAAPPLQQAPGGLSPAAPAFAPLGGLPPSARGPAPPALGAPPPGAAAAAGGAAPGLPGAPGVPAGPGGLAILQNNFVQPQLDALRAQIMGYKVLSNIVRVKREAPALKAQAQELAAKEAALAARAGGAGGGAGGEEEELAAARAQLKEVLGKLDSQPALQQQLERLYAKATHPPPLPPGALALEAGQRAAIVARAQAAAAAAQHAALAAAAARMAQAQVAAAAHAAAGAAAAAAAAPPQAPAHVTRSAAPAPAAAGQHKGLEKDEAPELTARRMATGPLYVLAPPPKHHPRVADPPPNPAQLRSLQQATDLPALLRREYEGTLERRKRELLAAAQQAISAGCAAAPGFRYRSAQMPTGQALLLSRAARLLGLQRALRDRADAEGQEISEMQDKRHRNLQRSQRSQRIEAARRDIAARGERAAGWARDAKAFKSDVMGERCSHLKDLRIGRNRGVLRAHERLARERNKLRDDDRAMRLEALKAHDFEAYQDMLRQQAGAGGAGGAGEKYEAISKFLQETEDYLHRLAHKIASVKLSAEVSAAVAAAIADARAKGLGEEEVQAAAHAAAEEAAASSDVRRQAQGGVDAQSRYYALAHSAQEDVVEQPKLLRPPGSASLREYQLVGLQWMISLYNNHLNGILADEMGLGKTVQVMSLVAYLMERKNNFGPHLIIVPNAVIVNWKSELTQWLPSVRCVYYVGSKEERARKYQAEVASLQFNVLVTTYEFIMRDRTKLSKIDWQYIVIDEAQRMKDRQSKLARDLDRFTAQRRLLLSGTPLQNDLQELWSLLNLLLPEVFDDKKMFAEWFGDAIAGDKGGGEDWLAQERRVVVIHRLHQILEPFMLRRQVEDVESKLPPKVPVVVKVPMSATQAAIYDWVKATGTIRLDPSQAAVGRSRLPYASLNNRCMELRKVCNHPLLSYPPPSYAVGDAIVRQCGKLVVLDRLLLKLRASGHRVLLFSTMTRLLDLLEAYLRWRRLPDSMGGGYLNYLRIDGSTALDDREAAIQRFNAPGSDAFVFLLSIRAAGRGLNLQSSDTVVIYDPDPNPKNEEQAIARSHRIGQTREVRVLHLEAVADAVVWAHRHGGAGPPARPPTTPDGRVLYADSIESVVRDQIQRQKIEMASEVIDAGRFDQRTSMEERRATLEELMQDQSRALKAANVADTWEELNRKVARSDEEFELFQKMDREEEWYEPTSPEEVPAFMRWGEGDMPGACALARRHAPDVQAEMAALTGTVLVGHHAPAAGAADAGRRPGAPPARGPPGPPGRPGLSSAAVLAAIQAQFQKKKEGEEAAAAAAAPAGSEGEGPEPTTTTHSSLGGEASEEVEFGLDDEEEVLDQNIITDDDATTTASEQAQPTGASGGGSMHAASVTALAGPRGASPPAPADGASAGAPPGQQQQQQQQQQRAASLPPRAPVLAGGGASPPPAEGGATQAEEDAGGDEPPAKRSRKQLSVHFADGDPQQQQEQQGVAAAAGGGGGAPEGAAPQGPAAAATWPPEQQQSQPPGAQQQQQQQEQEQEQQLLQGGGTAPMQQGWASG